MEPSLFKTEEDRARYKVIMDPFNKLRREGGMVPCEQDPEMWWTDDKPTQQEAADACRLCPLMAACGQWAIEGRERMGVWGGMTPAQRASVIRRRQRGLPDLPDDKPVLKRPASPRLPEPDDEGIPDFIDPKDKRHGTLTLYDRRCRCKECRRAKADSRRRKKDFQVHGIPEDA